MDRERLLENLRWLAEGNPQYAGTDEEGRQNAVVAHLMADDFLLSYLDDREILSSSTAYAKAVRSKTLRPADPRRT